MAASISRAKIETDAPPRMIKSIRAFLRPRKIGTPSTDQCRNRRNANIDHNSISQTCHNNGDGEGQLELEKKLPLAHPHSLSGFDDWRVNLSDRCIGVPQYGQLAVDYQSDDGRKEPDGFQPYTTEQEH